MRKGGNAGEGAKAEAGLGVIGRQPLPLGKREDREVKPARPTATKGIEPRIARISRIGN